MQNKELPVSIQILDRTEHALTADILHPFAVDELLCRQIAKGRMPVVHLWRHKKALVLGLRDRRLPNALQAMEQLERDGYAVTVRHSGGAAVPLDDGVVNISFILPKMSSDLEFNPYFELMYRMLQRTLRHFSLKADKGEISGSYCPGDYDLSIEGRKFCGLAQRRQTKAFVVQAFVAVEGRGEERAKVASDFYHTATFREAAELQHPNDPQIEPSAMISLQQVNGEINVGNFIEAFKAELRLDGGISVDWNKVEPELEEIDQMTSQLRKNYEKRE